MSQRSPEGRPLVFSNEDFSGGYAASYADTGEEYPSHSCFISGVAGQADEAKFGGIVIQACPVKPSPRAQGIRRGPATS